MISAISKAKCIKTLINNRVVGDSTCEILSAGY